MKKFFYGKHFLDKKDHDAVNNVLKSNYLTNGPKVTEFESALKKYFNNKYCISCSSGTSAILLAFRSINLRENDVVIMPSINFVASMHMAKLLKANVYLSDVNPFTGQMEPSNVEDCIKKNKLKKIKLIITMYLGGYPLDVVNFNKLKKKYNCFIIEDSCHAMGAYYFHNKKKYMIGSNKHSDISIFSFHPVKPITTGEGGAVTTSNLKLNKIMQKLKSHGIIKNKKKNWSYDIIDIGYNFRLSDINCALGISQLKKINKFLSYRKKVYKYYRVNLSGYKNIIQINEFAKEIGPSYHLVIANINFKKLRLNKDKFLGNLNKLGIILQVHYIPLYKFYTYKNDYKKLKGAENYYLNSFSLPIYHNIKKQELLNIVKKIKFVIDKNIIN
jgi:dTDP-4-amino-4,6-dideoxygalactose transaminase